MALIQSLHISFCVSDQKAYGANPSTLSDSRGMVPARGLVDGSRGSGFFLA